MNMTWRILPAAPVVALLLACSVHAETTTGATIGVDGGYGSNPNLAAGNGKDSASLAVTVAPQVTVSGPRSTFALFGRAEQVFYSNTFGDQTNWSAGSSLSYLLGPLSNLSLGANYSSAVNNGLTSSVVQADPNSDPNIVPPDPSAIELAGYRTKTFGANVGFSTSFSPRDSLNLAGAVSKVNQAILGYSNYTSYSSRAGFLHAFSEKLSMGASVAYSQTNYELSQFGTARQVTPAIDARLKLAPRTSLNISAGATVNRTTGGINPQPSRVFAYGSATLCHQGDRSNLCLLASRSVGATVQIGNSTVTSVAANYSYLLSPRSSIAFSADYSRSSSISGPALGDSEYGTVTSTYSRTITQRLSFVVNARYTEPFTSVSSRGRSYYGGVALTYRLGR